MMDTVEKSSPNPQRHATLSGPGDTLYAACMRRIQHGAARLTLSRASAFPSLRRLAAHAALLTLIASPTMVFAQSIAAAPSGVLSLHASASTDVNADVVRITMFTEQEGPDPAVLSQQLNQRTEAALKSSTGQDAVKVKTGAFSISPSTDRDGRISAWRGRSELELQSSDFAAASRLAGRLSSTLQVGGVDFSLSPDAQHRAESALTSQAIASFKQQAMAAAEAFGYTGFSVREVNVGSNGMPYQPRMAMREMAASPSMAKMDAVPLQGGTTSVTVSVNGTVQMK